MNNEICVVGYGMVGKALADVFGIEKIFTRSEKESTITLEEAAKCSVIFICLPTPVNQDGTYFTTDIESIVGQIASTGSSAIVVIRSTVYPGFGKKLQEQYPNLFIVSNPEFLSEATALEDTKNPPFIVLGGAEDPRKVVEAFYRTRIKGAPTIMTDNVTAEMAKLTMNAYFATKVIFANQAYDACKNLGANYGTVKKVLESHPYGPKNHFKIWFKGKRGVHGRCLPKDTHAYAYYTGSKLAWKVIESNKDIVDLKEDNEA